MLSLLELSLTGGVFILAVVVVRALAMNRLPRQAFLLLWAVALARLLLPFSIPSPTSLYSAAGHLGEGFRRAGIVTAGGTDAAGAAAQEAVIPWMALLWAAGALACALCFLLPHLRGRREWNASLPVEDPFVTAWLDGHPIRRRVRVRCSDRVDSPLTYGLLRPVILLPKTLDRSDVSRLAFVLTHEMAHIRRFDALSKLLLAAAACLHWFNPLVWVMLVLANRDLELSCDAAVVRLYGAEARAPYARTLLELEARRSRFLPLCSAFNKNALEERIGAIMRSRKTSAAALAVALVLVVALTAVLATNAPRERPIASASGLTIRDNGVVTAYQEGVWDSSGELKPDPQTGHYYTKEQYEQVAALKTEGYESLSIAEFNRTLYAALNESEALSEAFGRVLMDLPETDPLAPFLVNTAQPSLNEYNARLNEVYSGRAEDPSFSGQLSRTETANVYGDTVEVGWTEAGYSFTYRILDQDGLTVAERDAFLQSILKGMQDCLDDLSTESLRDEGKLKQTLQAELDRLGAAAATGQIAYTGGAVEGCWSEAPMTARVRLSPTIWSWRAWHEEPAGHYPLRRGIPAGRRRPAHPLAGSLPGSRRRAELHTLAPLPRTLYPGGSGRGPGPAHRGI